MDYVEEYHCSCLNEAAFHVLNGARVTHKEYKRSSNKIKKRLGINWYSVFTLAMVPKDSMEKWRDHIANVNVREYINIRQKLKKIKAEGKLADY